MGALIESTIVNQLKKAQGETNDRLDKIIVLLQQLTNQLNKP
jgi:hypothetical protein